MVGVQWHAECLVEHDEQAALFSALVDACIERAAVTATPPDVASLPVAESA
jgi:hypothetical protein